MYPIEKRWMSEPIPVMMRVIQTDRASIWKEALMRSCSKSMMLNNLTICVPCSPEKRVVAKINAAKTTPVAKPPTKVLGSFLPKSPLIAKPIKGSAMMRRSVRSFAIVNF